MAACGMDRSCCWCNGGNFIWIDGAVKRELDMGEVDHIENWDDMTDEQLQAALADVDDDVGHFLRGGGQVPHLSAAEPPVQRWEPPHPCADVFDPGPLCQRSWSPQRCFPCD